MRLFDHLPEGRAMKPVVKRILYWSPRVLTILVALFLSLFALDVFEEGRGIGETIIALLIHLVPTWIVLAVLLLAWRWEWLGTLLYVAAGMLYLVKNLNHPDWILVISGPLFLVGVLFLLGWLLRARIRGGT